MDVDELVSTVSTLVFCGRGQCRGSSCCDLYSRFSSVLEFPKEKVLRVCQDTCRWRLCGQTRWQ
eukprot:2604606-Amphidinium_carterae.1